MIATQRSPNLKSALFQTMLSLILYFLVYLLGMFFFNIFKHVSIADKYAIFISVILALFFSSYFFLYDRCTIAGIPYCVLTLCSILNCKDLVLKSKFQCFCPNPPAPKLTFLPQKKYFFKTFLKIL